MKNKYYQDWQYFFLIKKNKGVKSGCLYGEELDSMLGGVVVCWFVGYPNP